MPKLKDTILLNHLENKGMIALIQADKIEFLDNKDNWIKMSDLGLSYIPIVIYTSKIIDENSQSISYKLHYQLLILNNNIEPAQTENINFKTKDFKKEYKKTENENYDDSQIKYDNKQINTFSKIVGETVLESYLRRQKRKLYHASSIINETIKKPKVKIK